jgi:hypothetical protein
MQSSTVQYTFGQAGAMRGGGERKSQNLDSSLEEQDENYDTLPAGALRTSLTHSILYLQETLSRLFVPVYFARTIENYLAQGTDIPRVPQCLSPRRN